ncbi:MAG: hypothetical protein F9K29_03600 [Hyphomicrobiaceae bacterium]|nr:MAG: hypothetical protein F9K29_03600 [Hyphomicrobiaceae bacterium]
MRSVFLLFLFSINALSSSAVACEGRLVKLRYVYSEVRTKDPGSETLTVERTLEGCVDPELRKSILDSIDATTLVLRDGGGRVLATGADAAKAARRHSVDLAKWLWQNIIPSAEAAHERESGKCKSNMLGTLGRGSVMTGLNR